jgi:hypothetical protein
MDKKSFSVLSFFHRYRGYFFLAVFLAVMILLHRYIFLYADDLYYCRDSAYGISSLPHFALKELRSNGRVWLGLALWFVLKDQITFFRIVNPIVIALTALIIAKISTNNDQKAKAAGRKNFQTALICAGVFFLFLPVEITNTTIYYAACSFSYLYPMTLVLLYAYLLDETLNRGGKRKRKFGLILLAFLAGSSTQQGGMMAIGYTVLFHFYFRFAKKQNIGRKLIPAYLAVFAGYAMIVYGSYQRMLTEQQMGQTVYLPDVIQGLLKINIFSAPVILFVLLVCISCFFWLRDLNSTGHLNPKILGHISRFLLIVLPLAVLGYLYFVVYKAYSFEQPLCGGGMVSLILSLFMLGFTAVYLGSILFCSFLVYRQEGYPLLLFHTLNAVGAQIMLLVVNARYASTYKVMFPSLLLLGVFIIYSFLRFSSNRYYVAAVFSALILTFGLKPDFIGFMPLLLLMAWLIIRFRFCYRGCFVLFLGITLFFFSHTYEGYKEQAPLQEQNLQAIALYRQSVSREVLRLKKVPASIYGYNVTNWNDMPYFMKECYQIDPNTRIEYQ